MEKRLQRSRDKKVLAGIAGGLGDYLDIDPVIIRIVIVLITIFTGIGLLIYIVMWIVIPEEPFNNAFFQSQTGNTENMGETFGNETNNLNAEINTKPTSSNGRIIVGIVLIFIGIIFLAEKVFPFIDFEFVFAIGMIALGASLIFNFFTKSEKSS